MVESLTNGVTDQPSTLNPYQRIHNKPKKKLSEDAQINVKCDAMASETTVIALDGDIPADLPPTLSLFPIQDPKHF